MDTSYYPPILHSPLGFTHLSFLYPVSFSTAFLVMREGANNHHLSVISSVLNSDPIREFVAAKASSPHQPTDAINHNDFPPLQEVTAPNRPQQQADLPVNTSTSSPCSPQSSIFTAAGSSSSQRSMELMHLSPPLMEKLEADLVLLQKKYGLVSQALTPARKPHQEASLVQTDLISSKQAAMATFASPLRHNTVKPSMVLKTEGPFALNPMNSSSPYHSPTHRSNSNAQLTNCAPPVRGNSPLSSNNQSYTCKEPVRGYGSTSALICADSVLGSAQHNPTIQFINSTEATRGNAHRQSPNAQSSTCTEPVRGFAPPTAQIGADSVLGKAPLHNSAQCTEPARGTSWAARLGGSRSTSSTPLSFYPPTLVAGKQGLIKLYFMEFMVGMSGMTWKLSLLQVASIILRMILIKKMLAGPRNPVLKKSYM